MKNYLFSKNEVLNTSVKLAILSVKPVDDKIKNLKNHPKKEKAA